jgi:hypothetical protein
MSLFPQVSQLLLDCLHFQLEFAEIGLQDSHLFRLGLVPALKVTVISAAFTAAVAGRVIFAPAGAIVAIALFFV